MKCNRLWRKWLTRADRVSVAVALIYWLPDQTFDQWEHTLDSVGELFPDGVSLSLF